MKLHWSSIARSDRREIYNYIETDNPSAALRIDELIEQATDRLEHFPEIGRRGRVPGTRELVISRTPYLAIYEIDKDVIRILRVLHGAQRWPPVPLGEDLPIDE